MPNGFYIPEGVRIPLRGGLFALLLAIWIVLVDRDFIALVGVAALYACYRVVSGLLQNLGKRVATESTVPPWWSDFFDVPHPADKSPLAESYRRRYPRRCRRFYPADYEDGSEVYPSDDPA